MVFLEKNIRSSYIRCMSSQGVYKVEEIANYFIKKGIEENIPVNPMKLQKLLYFVYGWYMAYFDKKLFESTIEAWPYGPVVPSIYHEVKQYGNFPITAPISSYIISDMSVFSFKYSTPEFSAKDEQDAKFIDAFWNAFSKYDQFQLSNATHEPGTPWDTIYQKYNQVIPRNEKIPDEIIKEYFKSIIGKKEVAKAAN